MIFFYTRILLILFVVLCENVFKNNVSYCYQWETSIINTSSCLPKSLSTRPILFHLENWYWLSIMRERHAMTMWKHSLSNIKGLRTKQRITATKRFNFLSSYIGQLYKIISIHIACLEHMFPLFRDWWVESSTQLKSFHGRISCISGGHISKSTDHLSSICYGERRYKKTRYGVCPSWFFTPSPLLRISCPVPVSTVILIWCSLEWLGTGFTHLYIPRTRD